MTSRRQDSTIPVGIAGRKNGATSPIRDPEGKRTDPPASKWLKKKKAKRKKEETNYNYELRRLEEEEKNFHVISRRWPRNTPERLLFYCCCYCHGRRRTYVWTMRVSSPSSPSSSNISLVGCLILHQCPIRAVQCNNNTNTAGTRRRRLFCISLSF